MPPGETSRTLQRFARLRVRCSREKAAATAWTVLLPLICRVADVQNRLRCGKNRSAVAAERAW